MRLLYALRKGLRLDKEDARLVLTDDVTCRRFHIPKPEEAALESLLAGTSASDLDRLLNNANVTMGSREYANIYGALHLLDDGSASSPQDLRRKLRTDLDVQLLDKLRALVEHAKTEIAFYRDRDRAIDINDLRTLADFSRLVPLLSRETYRASFPDRFLPDGTSYLALSTDPNYRVKMSAGTTSERIQVVQRVEYLMAVFSSSFLYENVFDERHAIFGPLRCMEMDCFTETPSFDQRYHRDAGVLMLATANAMDISPTEAARLLAELTDTGITRVVANPFYLAFASRQAASASGALPNIRTLHLGYDYVQMTTRAFLHRTYDCDPADIYGMTEGGFQLMRSCPQRSIHLNEEFFHFEFLPELDSQTHRLVFTTLHSDVTPLLRYKTSDLFAVDKAAGPCACGSPLGRVQHFDGREQDIITIGGVSAALGVVDRAIGAIDGVAMYRLRIHRDASSVELRYLETDRAGHGNGHGALNSEIEERATNAFQRLFPSSKVKVTARATDRFSLGRSGKFLCVEHI